MVGVTFDNYHSYDDFSLILNSKEIEAPSPKTETVDIPGGDGVIDLTEAFGEVKFKNRKITLNFSTIVPQSQFLELFSKIQNKIHGRKMKIILDSDPEFWYYGRITVDKWKADKNIGKITIECDCEPYKYKLYETIRTEIITGSITLAFANLRKTVSPKITLSNSAEILFNGVTYDLSVGTYCSPDIVFTMGNNLMTKTGNTAITVEYQEGEL